MASKTISGKHVLVMAVVAAGVVVLMAKTGVMKKL